MREDRARLLKDAPSLAQGTLDGLGEHIAVVDASGTIIATNLAWQEFALRNGGSIEATGLGVSYFDVCERSTGRDRPEALAAEEGIRAVLRGDQGTFDMTYPCHSPDQRRWFRMRVTAFAGTHARAVVLSHQNMTEPMLAQQAVQDAKDEADNANAAKDRFLANLSHELRAPLTPVLVATQMMQRDSSLSPEQRDCAEMVARNVKIEARLIDDLLDLTRIGRGKLELSVGPVDLHALVQDVLSICSEEVRAKHHTVEMQLNASHHHVQGDAARLHQAVWNLVKNAVKFTADGGRITLRTSQPDGSRIAFSISDTGVGIDPAMLPHIFNAFEQGGREVTRQFGGLGLGLAISKGIAELHGGSLTAYSEGPGHGATMTLELATSVATEPPAAPHPAEVAQHRGARVLLVEDHRDTRILLAKALRMHGFSVSSAGTVADALQLAAGSDFDLLLSDIGLPDGSGLDLMQQLLARKKLLKAIALSGFGTAEDIRRSRESGFQEHLTKPISLNLLEEAADRLLAR